MQRLFQQAVTFIRTWQVQAAARDRSVGTNPAAALGNSNFQKRQELQKVLARQLEDTPHGEIEVRHVMSRSVRTVSLTTSVKQMRGLMKKEGFHHLLVLNQGELSGVISDRDIQGRRGRLARHIMTADPLTVSPATPLVQAITVMLHRRISCLPVVEDGRLAGILTVTDMLMTLQCLMKVRERQPSAASHTEPRDEPSPGPVDEEMLSSAYLCI